MTTLMTPTEDLDFLGSRARVLIDGGASAGALGLVEMVEMPAGSMPPLHLHHNEDEGFHVVEGELTLLLPGRTQRLRAGESAIAPRGVRHAYEVGPDGARVLVTSRPAGFERFVAEVAARPGLDPDGLTALAAEHAIEILGPPGARP